METVSSPLSDQLANVSPAVVVAVVLALTLVRIAVTKMQDSWARTIAEICDTVNFVLILAFLLIRPIIAQPFYIPSESMENTLLINDRLIVDKFSYRLHPPQRHDVVVFVAPAEATPERQEGIDFIKRLVGLPGQTIQVKAAKLTIGGETITRVSDTEGNDPHEYLRARFGLGINDSIKFFPDHILINGTQELRPQEIAQRLEQPGAKVILTPGQTLVDGKVEEEPYTREDPGYNYPVNGGSLTIPPGHFFMMGDNRNRSDDSHIWGPLDERRVVGHANVIFWPLSRMGRIR